jgi:hypothetical protein
MTTEIVETRKLSNGQRCVVIRCDGNPQSDYPHTFNIKPSMTADDVQAEIDFATQKATELYAAAQVADSVFDTAVAAQAAKRQA